MKTTFHAASPKFDGRTIYSVLGFFPIILLLTTGCEQNCPADYSGREETGYVRCGYSDEKDDDDNPIPIRCDVLNDEYCCLLGEYVDERSCETEPECEKKREEIPGITWIAECDENTDCAALYGNELPYCCSSLVKRESWCAEECPIKKGDQNEVCLTSWNCAPDQVCMGNPFLAEIWNCVWEWDQTLQ